MDNAIVKAHQNIIATMDDAERAARAMSASGFFPDSKQAAQAVVKILAGQELGFGPFASMTGVAIIQGKPAIGANLMAAAVKRTGKYNYRVVSLTDDGCELAFFEGGKEVGRSAFVKQDAMSAGLLTKDNWMKYPRNMYFARALSNGVRWYAPDIYNGATVYTPDELDAVVDAEGNAVEATSAPLPVTAVTEDPEEAYDRASKVVVKVSGGQERFVSELTKEQLDFLMTSDKSTHEQKDAAKIVLAHDFQMEAEPQ
jgi:hypothetical protein